MDQNSKYIPIIQEGEASLIQPIDLEGFRQHNRNKTKALVDKTMTEEEAIDKVIKSILKPPSSAPWTASSGQGRGSVAGNEYARQAYLKSQAYGQKPATTQAARDSLDITRDNFEQVSARGDQQLANPHLSCC